MLSELSAAGSGIVINIFEGYSTSRGATAKLLLQKPNKCATVADRAASVDLSGVFTGAEVHRSQR